MSAFTRASVHGRASEPTRSRDDRRVEGSEDAARFGPTTIASCRKLAQAACAHRAARNCVGALCCGREASGFAREGEAPAVGRVRGEGEGVEELLGEGPVAREDGGLQARGGVLAQAQTLLRLEVGDGAGGHGRCQVV